MAKNVDFFLLQDKKLATPVLVINQIIFYIVFCQAMQHNFNMNLVHILYTYSVYVYIYLERISALLLAFPNHCTIKRPRDFTVQAVSPVN